MRESTLQGQYAGCATRLFAFVVDVAIVSISLIFVGWIAASTLRIVGIDVTACAPLTQDGSISNWICRLSRVGLLLFGALFAPVYALFFWVLAGQTLGKALMGARIVRLDGKPLGFRHSFARLIGYGVTLVTLGLGFAWVVLDDRRMALHDKIARTCVIYSWEAREDTYFLSRLVSRLQAWRRSVPVLSVATPEEIASRHYELVMMNFGNIRQALDDWQTLRGWNLDDPATVIRAALVLRESSRRRFTIEPKYQLDGKQVPGPRLWTQDGLTVEQKARDTIDTQPDGTGTIVAVVDGTWIARLTQQHEAGEVPIVREPVFFQVAGVPGQVPAASDGVKAAVDSEAPSQSQP